MDRSQWPAPTIRIDEGQQKQQKSYSFNDKPTNKVSQTKPVVIQADIFSAPKDEGASSNNQREGGQKMTDWWSVGIGIATVLILLLQTAVFGRQAFRLRQTVKYMREQGNDMQNSIAQAVRAANAMENVAAGINETVITNRTVVENQRDFWSRQMRAYVSVDTGGDRRQGGNIRFEFRPTIANSGQTPANNVRVLSKCQVSTANIPEDFDFSVQFEGSGTGSVATMFPRQTKFHANIFSRKCTIQEMRRLLVGQLVFHLWGKITYDDIFEKEHFTNFSYLIFVPTNKRGSTIWHTTDRHNDAD